MTEYTSTALKKIRDFCRRFDCLVIIVAHPTKGATQKEPNEIGLYDIADSAAFANRADLGVTIARVGDPETESEHEMGRCGVFVKKVRYQPLAGVLCEAELRFDKSSGLFLDGARE